MTRLLVIRRDPPVREEAQSENGQRDPEQDPKDGERRVIDGRVERSSHSFGGEDHDNVANT